MQFETYEAGCGHCARIRGIETVIISKKYNGNNWQAVEEVVLPKGCLIEFVYAVCGNENEYTKYLASPQGIREIAYE